MEGLETLDGRRLAYRRTGEGPVLVCHGGGPGFSSLYLGDLAGLGDELEGHFVFVEAPEPFRAAVLAFLGAGARA
jgi:pimeloyl-ACP methyl ester carboxylesterase